MGKQNSKPKMDNKELEDLKKITEFSRKEIKEWYKEFLMKTSNGCISLEDLQESWQNHYPDGDASKFTEYVFRSIDTNGDGQVDFREFLCALSVLIRGQPEDTLKWWFNLYDLDGNGSISRPEMLEILTAVNRMVVSVAEMPEDETTPEMRTDKIFRLIDKNQDGKLSLQEFIIGAINDPSILSLFKGVPKGQ